MNRECFVVVGLLLIAGGTYGATQLVERAELVVQAPELQSARVVGRDASAAASLSSTPGIIVSSQGVAGGQSDLAIRGSSFSGAGISLAGLALRSPQTEHFNAELPIASGVLQAPTILSGFDQLLAGEGHLVGSAVFGIMPIENSRRLTTGVSEYNGYWMDLLVQQQLERLSGGVGGFAGYSSLDSVDNLGNDLRTARGGGQMQFWGDSSRFDLIAAYQQKDFGARGYYGVTPDWDADETLEDTLVLASWLQGDESQEYFRCSAIYRELVDDYTLYWSLPGVYNNRHHSTIYSGSLSGREYLGIWSLDWRLAAEDERIKSRALGDHARSSASGLFLPGVLAGSWKLNAGLKYSYFEDYDDELLPQAALEFFWGRGYGIRLSHSQSMRQPSYTELNYESPASLGNAGLDSQRAESTELRLSGKFTARGDWHTAIFHRTTHDMVDWVRETKQSLRWSAVNLDKVDTDGIECGASFAAESGHRASILYSFMHKSSQSDVYSSRYALDYPEHYLLLSGLWQICHGIGIELAQSVHAQSDNPLRGSSDYGFNGFLALHVVPRDYKWMQLSLMVNNLWDDDFEHFPGQETYAPRRVSASLTLDW